MQSHDEGPALLCSALPTMDFLHDLTSGASPWSWVVSLVLILTINSTLQWLLRPRNQPPFYFEFPYIPWLGSLVQFATQPREFLERAAKKCGNVFTIQLFGKKMTFLMGTDGHAHFFRAKEHVFDIREACAWQQSNNTLRSSFAFQLSLM